MNACRKLKTGLTLTLAALLLAGCASTTTTTQGFRVVANPRVDSSYIALGADFSRYDRLSAKEMGIYFPADASLAVADQERLRQIFRDAFLTELSGYEVVLDEPGPTTLEAQASLIDFRHATPDDVMSLGRQIRDVANPGSIIFLMELKDSETGNVLARAADSAEIPAWSTSADAPTDWDAVQAAAENWADLFRDFLDANLNK